MSNFINNSPRLVASCVALVLLSFSVLLRPPMSFVEVAENCRRCEKQIGGQSF